MQRLLTVALISLLVVGCDQYTQGHYSKDWDKKRINAWMKKAKSECEKNGYAIDRASGGYTRISEVRLCPDGSLAILPLD